MSEHPGVGVLPFDGMGLYEQPRPTRLVFKMPRVVPDQKSKFESDELFRRLSRESEVSPSARTRENNKHRHMYKKLSYDKKSISWFVL